MALIYRDRQVKGAFRGETKDSLTIAPPTESNISELSSQFYRLQYFLRGVIVLHK